MTTPMMVQDGMVVSLEYSLRLDDGEVIDSSTDGEPLLFLQGAGQIITGLEQALYGMAVGEEKQVTVVPADGYGEMDPQGVQFFPTSNFPEDMELEVGMALQAQDNSGHVHTVYVSEVQQDGVMLDFNHPLAGETLHFQARIAALRPATDEELAHGHVHGHAHAHEHGH
jgi:FKBP-type peptidyl-prolyl cis-trans isomerase SlyD